MLSCREYARAAAAGEFERAGLARRLAAGYHWLICRYCRAYTRQLRTLGGLARRALGRTADEQALAELEERLAKRCRAARSGETTVGEPPPRDSSPG